MYEIVEIEPTEEEQMIEQTGKAMEMLSVDLSSLLVNLTDEQALQVQAFCHEGKWHHIEVEDDVTAYLEYENGATGVFITSTGDAPGTNRLEIDLERAKLVSEKGKLMMYEMN